ncbi:MAG: DUF1883 domain-containing protein [Negativicutes bacterium]|jgi:hypothetical protein
MTPQYYDLGYLSRGETVVVSLSGSAAFVRLLDNDNLLRYKGGQQHHYCGGQATQSPVKLDVQYFGHWHVAIDFGEFNGIVKSSVQVVPYGAKPL